MRDDSPTRMFTPYAGVPTSSIPSFRPDHERQSRLEIGAQIMSHHYKSKGLHAIPNGHTGSSSPDDQYVSSLASQWTHVIAYLKEVYPQAARTETIGFSPLCNIGLTIASLNYGLMTTLGLGIDGKPAQGPRPGAVGLALDESIPAGDLRTVYRGIAPSQLPGILAMGEWGCATPVLPPASGISVKITPR